MSGNKLNVLLYDRQVGTLEQTREGVYFSYATSWLNDISDGRGGHALSISMPLNKVEHAPRAVEPFLAGLLPDSAIHRRKIAESFGIDPGHASDFEFLRRIGRDCAGAEFFTDPEDPYADLRDPPSLKRLTDADLAQYLRDLPVRPLVDDPETGTRLSLAGVNDKTAVVISEGAGFSATKWLPVIAHPQGRYRRFEGLDPHRAFLPLPRGKMRHPRTQTIDPSGRRSGLHARGAVR